MEFAKIFDTQKGQILAIKESNNEGAPELIFYAKPEGLGVCKIAMTYNDDNEGWDKQESVFEGLTEELALMATKTLFEFGNKE